MPSADRKNVPRDPASAGTKLLVSLGAAMVGGAAAAAAGASRAAPPEYSDFAYLAFTIGMTFQVSDTNIKTKQIRRTALRHALMSFPLVAVIIATSINLVSGLAK